MALNFDIKAERKVPKYVQLVEAVESAVKNGALKQGMQAPSIQQLSAQYKISPGTIVKAYKILREQGTLTSRQGKGYFIASTQVSTTFNIFLLFNELNAYKEILYQSFRQGMGKEARLQVFFHHHNRELFEGLILDHLGKHTHYVIMPHFNEDVSEILSVIPEEKLLIIDKDIPALNGKFAAVYQDFENDVFQALEEATDLLRKYEHLYLITSEDHFQFVPDGIIQGFRRYCLDNKKRFSIEAELNNEQVAEKTAFLVFTDQDLVRLIKIAENKSLILGAQLGIISYDETPLKQVIAGGITVISTDFVQMGQTAANLIRTNDKVKIANPSRLIRRKTL